MNNELVKPIIDSVLEKANSTLTHEVARRLITQNPAINQYLKLHAGRDELYITEDLDLPYDLKLKRGTLGKGDTADNSYFEIYAWFNRMGFVKNLPTKVIDEALRRTALNNRPITFFDELLTDAKTSGQYDALIYRRVMVDWLGAKDEDYTYDWLKLLMIDIYRNQTFNGRVDNYNPAPHMFVTQSVQGVGKSLFMAGISGGKNVTYNSNIKPDELALYMGRYMVIDMDDLAGSGEKNSVDMLKQRVTQKTIRFRQLYTQSITEMPNRAVWVGSTNRFNIFTDTSGDRRSFPINLGTDRNKKNANQIGQQRYRDIYTPKMFLDLWRTFLIDLEDGKISQDFNYGSPADEMRIKYVKGFTIESDLESTIVDLLNKPVPNTLFDNDKNDIIKYLTDGDYQRGELANIAGSVYDEMIPLSDFESIPETVINKSVKTITGRSYRQSIVEMMREKGYSSGRSGSRDYVKIKD